jgi:hypothetical protein
MSVRAGPLPSAEAVRRLVSIWLLHQRLVLRAEPGCPGRGAEGAERHVSLGVDLKRVVLPAKWSLIFSASHAFSVAVLPSV